MVQIFNNKILGVTKMAKYTLQDILNKGSLSTALEELAKKYVAQETGKQLIETTKVAKLDGIEEGAQANKIETVNFNGTEAVISGKKATITVDVVASKDLEEKVFDLGFITDDDIKDTYAKVEDVEDELEKKLDSATAETTYVKEAGFNDKVKGVVGSVYHPKGSLANYAAIQAVEDAEEGDVYNALDTGANYAYTAEGTWDKLSETVDLSGYYNKTEVDGKLDLKANTADIEKDYAKKTDLPSDYLTDDDIKDLLKADDIAITICSDDDIRALFA